MLIIASAQLHFVGCVMKLFKKLVKVKKIIYKQSINIFSPQIEELTSNLPQLQSLSSSASSVESVVSSETASPPSKRKVVTKVQGSARKALLKWIQYTAAK